MHEFSIVTDIVETVLEFAANNPDKTVRKVRLQIGELTCVDPEQLKFCYESVIKNSVLEESTLEIETLPTLVKCSRCHYEGPPRYWQDTLTVAVPTLQCPQCGSAAEAIAGHECAIKSLQCLTAEPQTTF